MKEVIIQMADNPDVIGKKPSTSKEEAMEFCLKQISDIPNEVIAAFNADSDIYLMSKNIIVNGTADSPLCRTTDFWKPAVLSNASYMIVAHHYPDSERLIPTESDLRLCRELAVSGYHLGIMLWDYLIYHGDKYISFQDEYSEYINLEKILGENLIEKNY